MLQKSKNAKTFVTNINKVKPFLSDHPPSWLKTPELPQTSVADKEVEQPAVAAGSVGSAEEDISFDASGEEVESQQLSPNRPSSKLETAKVIERVCGDTTGETLNADYAVDEGPQSRSRRKTRRAAMFNNRV